jgi:hypothetical protein
MLVCRVDLVWILRKWVGLLALLITNPVPPRICSTTIQKILKIFLRVDSLFSLALALKRALKEKVLSVVLELKNQDLPALNAEPVSPIVSALPWSVSERQWDWHLVL